MKEADVHKFLQRNRHKLIRLFNLQHFDLKLYTDKIEDVRGMIAINSAYRTIKIKVDASKIQNEKDLWYVIRHEFLHTLLLPLEQLEDLMTEMQLDPGSKKAVTESFRVACEQCVFNLERFEPIKKLDPPAK